MRIAKKYSHLNGEEYLIVHHEKLYEEIRDVIAGVDAEKLKIKVSKEKRMKGDKLYSPKDLNKAFSKKFSAKKWKDSRYSYYITLDRNLMDKSLTIPINKQKQFLVDHGEDNPIFSYNQTDFVKSKVEPPPKSRL